MVHQNINIGLDFVGDSEKGAPLTKNEVLLLINLIDSNRLMAIKGSSYHDNRRKDVVWRKVANAFNAAVPSRPRRIDQLRLKWENLKKNARKRASSMNQVGEKVADIQLNKVLDKVTAMLDPSCNDSLAVNNDADVTDNDTDMCDGETQPEGKNFTTNGQNDSETEQIPKSKNMQRRSLSSSGRSSPLTSSEMLLLINLINANKLLSIKGLNSADNQRKDAVWRKVAHAYNAAVPNRPRRIDQLKLKWENLKRAARKRPLLLNEERSQPSEGRKGNVTYGIDDTPPWYLCIFMALQHYLTMIGAIVAIPFILCPALCMEETDPDRSNIISTMIFVTGLITWLQATFGCRLPIVQGGTISFLVPTLAILGLPEWQCPSNDVLAAMTTEERRAVWTSRMCELSGAIAVAALFQMFGGYFGLIGSVLRFVTPLTIAPTVALVGLTLFDNAAHAAAQQWGIAAGTFILLTIFSQCMGDVQFPTLVWRRQTGFTLNWFPLFKLFPVLLTIAIMWAVCGILTLSNVFESGHPARTDLKLAIIKDAPWFRVPYPGQWGAPTVSVAGVLGMLAGVLACTVESISYYPTTARMCAAPPPPLHAINRGLGTEGLGTALAGLWGSGNGTNTFGENVGAIGVTKVGSRRVVQWAAGLMILQGVVGKLGAVFIIIPQPVVGGLFCVMFGMISAFGLSALQYVDLNSSRNLYIIGFSIFFPLVLTRWMSQHSGVIQTGVGAMDAVLQVLLSTSILVGGIVGCLLDNLIPGTDEERGLTAWAKEMSLEASGASEEGDTYDFPVGMTLIRRWKWTSYLPFMPTYEAGKFSALFQTKKQT